MTTPRDYYEILGIGRESGEAEIKSAYRKLALKYHPDRNPNDKSAEDKFKEATQAYEILKNPEKRSTYDQFGYAGLGQGGGFGTGGFGGFGGGFDVSDALRAFMRDFGGGSVFDDLFGMGGGAGSRRGNRGEDLRVTLKLTLEEISSGVEKSIKVKRLVKCDDCSGSGVAAGSSKKTCGQCRGAGQVRRISKTFLGTVQQIATCEVCRGAGEIIADPCRRCRGEGRIRGESNVKVNIPAGVSSGNYMTIDGMGNMAAHGGEPGDLLAVFNEKEHDYFVRNGDHLVCELSISFTTAALGGTVSVRTIDGEQQLKIPSGTQPGKVLKLKGKGVPHLNRHGRGDQLVHLVVWVPTRLSSDEKELLSRLSEQENMTPPKGSKSFFEKLRQSLGV